MLVTRELIQRFFDFTCSAEEAAAVVQFLKDNESILDGYLPKEEWDQITTKKGDLSSIQATQIYSLLDAQLFGNKTKKNILAPIKKFQQTWVIAAACAIFIVVITVFYISSTTQLGQTDIASKPRAKLVNNSIYNSSSKWEEVENTFANTKKYVLKDGSVVVLSPKSSIRFAKDFKERNIYLTGEAYFTVTKNKSRPFTVFTGAISTTALGTSFSIHAPASTTKKIHIKLYTGKVVVKAIHQKETIYKDIYMLPGDELVYNQLNMIGKITHFKGLDSNNTIRKELKSSIEHLTDSIQFEHTPLKEVLVKIQELYHIKIRCTSTQIENIDFTGTINKNNNVKNVLVIIAQMNGFTISEEKDGFILSLKK